MKSFLSLLFLSAVLFHSPIVAAAEENFRVYVQTAHGSPITCLAMTAGGEVAISGDENRVVKTWQTRDGKLLKTFPAPDDNQGGSKGLDSFMVSSSGKLLFLETWESVDEEPGFTSHIYDLDNGQELKFDIADHVPTGYPIFSGDEKFVYMAEIDDSKPRKDAYFQNKNGKFQLAANVPSDFASQVAEIVKKLKAVSASGDPSARQDHTKRQLKQRDYLLGLSKNRGVCTSFFFQKASSALEVTRSGYKLSPDKNGTGLVIQTPTTRLETKQRSALSGAIYFDITPDSRFVVSGHPDGSIRAWDLQEGKQIYYKMEAQTEVSDLKLIKSIYSANGSLSAYSLHKAGERSTVYRTDISANATKEIWKDKKTVVEIRTTADGSLLLLKLYENDMLGLVLDLASSLKTTIIDGGKFDRMGLLRLAEKGRTLFYGGTPYDLAPDLKKLTLAKPKSDSDIRTGRDVYEWLTGAATEVDTLYVESLGLRVVSFHDESESDERSLFVVRTSDYKVIAMGPLLKEGIEGASVALPKPSKDLGLTGLLGIVDKHILVVAEGPRVSYIDLETMKVLGTQILHLDAIEAISRNETSDHLVTAGSDGTISLWKWNASKNRLDRVVNLYALPKGEWLTMTNDGFFAGSENAGEYINVESKSAVYSVDQFYEALARSDLVKALLAGDPTRDYLKASTALNLGKILTSGAPPELRLVKQDMLNDGRSAKITVSVRDTGGGVGDIVWRDNGVAQGVQGRGVQVLTTDFEITQTIDLVPGPNEISVMAYNGTGLIRSAPLTLTIAGGSASAGNGRLFILAAGVNDYDDARFELARARDDATTIARKIAESAKGLFSDVQTKILLDRDVTRAGLSAAFAELAQEIKPEDKFVFFLAGHGKTIDGQYFFIGQDFNPDKGRDFDVAAIRQDQWQKWFVTIKARASLLIYDTCEAGTTTRALEGQNQAFDKLRDATGRSILSATSDEGAAIDSYGGHGLFTYALLHSLSDADYDHNNEIDINEMSMFATDAVPKISKANAGIIQLPWSRIEANFPIGMKLAASVAQGDGNENDAAPTTVNSFLIADSPVYRQSGGAEISGQLKAHDGVYAFDGPGDYVKVARSGKVLGYVRRDALQRLN